MLTECYIDEIDNDTFAFLEKNSPTGKLMWYKFEKISYNRFMLDVDIVTFRNCRFKNLDFMYANDTLTEITLDNLTKLVSVEKLSKFENLKFIVIKCCDGNHDIEKLCRMRKFERTNCF